MPILDLDIKKNARILISEDIRNPRVKIYQKHIISIHVSQLDRKYKNTMENR